MDVTRDFLISHEIAGAIHLTEQALVDDSVQGETAAQLVFSLGALRRAQRLLEGEPAAQVIQFPGEHSVGVG